MNIWKGAILGGLSKHRDYAHSSFYEHLKADGAIDGFRAEGDELLDITEYDASSLDDLEDEIIEQVRREASRLLEYWLTVNPTTGVEFDNPELYHALVITLKDNTYDYYIPSPGDGLTPSPELISATLDAYIENYIEDRIDLIEEHMQE